MPAKGELCSLGRYAGTLAERFRSAGVLLSVPRETRRVLRAIESSGPAAVDAFDRAARLFQVAVVCGARFPSVSMAYRVAAAEVLSEADPSCKGFRDFVTKYAPPRPENAMMLEYLWGSIRSAHFHAGAFPLGEFTSFSVDPFFDSDQMDRDELHRRCGDVLREAMVNWLLRVATDEREAVLRR
jgi:hypothetical protein